MSEKLKELLEKINQEGIKQAEEKARTIELKAQTQAKHIIEDAQNEAGKIIQEAKLDAQKTRQTFEQSLKHSSRDLVLSLKEEIKDIFGKIISAQTGQALFSPDKIASILSTLVENYIEKKGETSEVKVLLSKDDLEKIRDAFLAKLKGRLKEGIEFKASPNIATGFSISFDKGKSFFDFSEESLKEVLCAYLNPEIARIFK